MEKVFTKAHLKKLLYISCHVTLEAAEVETFSNLGFTVVSIGNFLQPQVSKELSNIDLGNLNYTKHDRLPPKFNTDQELISEFLKNNPDFRCIENRPYKLPLSFLEKFDVIVVSNYMACLPEILSNVNLNKQVVIWCSVGQTSPWVEAQLFTIRDKIKIIRVSETEEEVAHCAGTDAFIIGSVNEEEFIGWRGHREVVATVTRAMKRRAVETSFDNYLQITNGFSRVIYGTGNDDISNIPTAKLSYSELKDVYRDSRVMLCTGSKPAPVTYTFMEALMTGTPIVCLGRELASNGHTTLDFYNLPSYIQNGVNGLYSNSIPELREYLAMLLEDSSLAESISAEARKSALNYFSREVIQEKWINFFRRVL